MSSANRRSRSAPSSAEQPVLSRKHSQPANANDQLFMGIAIGGGIAGVATVVLLVIVFGISDLLNDSSNPAPAVALTNQPAVKRHQSVAPTRVGIDNNNTSVKNTADNGNTADVIASTPNTTTEPDAAMHGPMVTTTTPSDLDPANANSTSGQSDAPKTNTTNQKPTVVLKDRPAQKLDSVELIARVKPAVVRIHVVTDKGASEGSGFVVDKNGTVVTNYHVIQGAKRATVSFANDFETTVSGYYHILPKHDIAIIKIEKSPEGLDPIPLANALPAEGTKVYAFGAPQGLPFTTSEGIISAHRTREDMRKQLGIDVDGSWLQTTSPISPGSSGGPLVDLYGRVVAMNTLTMVVGQNLNFAMAATEIKSAVENSPSLLQSLEPTELSPYQKSMTRKSARDEIGTRSGNRLMANMKEVWLVSGKEALDFDPTGKVWDWVINKAEHTIESSDLELSFGQPSADAAVLLVLLDLKPVRSKLPGTQEVTIRAELICYDPQGGQFDKYCRVWQHEEKVGTISQQSLLLGRIPRRADDNLRSFYRSFRIALSKAKNTTSPLP